MLAERWWFGLVLQPQAWKTFRNWGNNELYFIPEYPWDKHEAVQQLKLAGNWVMKHETIPNIPVNLNRHREKKQSAGMAKWKSRPQPFWNVPGSYAAAIYVLHRMPFYAALYFSYFPPCLSNMASRWIHWSVDLRLNVSKTLCIESLKKLSDVPG